MNEAARLYHLAAEQGNVLAQHNLAVCYENALGVKGDMNEATKLYRFAAEQGKAPAQNNLGVCYENGQCVTWT